MSVTLTSLVLTISTAQSQSESTWQVIDARRVQMPPGMLYKVDNQGYIANYDVYMHIFNLQGELDFEYQYPVALSSWMNQTIAYTIVPGFGREPHIESPCGDKQKAVGLYNASNKSITRLCIDTPFFRNVDDSFAPLERDPFEANQIFADKRYLLDIETGNFQDIGGTFPIRVKPSDVTSWIAYDRIWWNPESHLPVAQADIHVTQLSHDRQEDIQICPLFPGDCETLFTVGTFVHGLVDFDDLIISPDGQYILWAAAVFPPGIQVECCGAIGVPHYMAAFQTALSTGETQPIFDSRDYLTKDDIPQFGRWSPDGRLLVISIERPLEEFRSYALFVTFHV